MRPFLIIIVLLGSSCTKRNEALCCLTEASCAGLDFPFPTTCNAGLACDGLNCVDPVCSQPTDCADPTTPYCVNSLCAACEPQTDLGCGATSPVCDAFTSTCGPCASPDDCESHPGTPICSPDGACIGCAGPGDCANPTPVCDATACRGCEQDAECASDLCDDEVGACVDPADAVFISINGSDAGACTQNTPCATFGYALQQTTTSRFHVVMLPGAYTLAHVVFGGGVNGQLIVLHATGASWEPQINPGSVERAAISVGAGTLRVIGLHISQATTTTNATAFKCVQNGELHLDGVGVDVTYPGVHTIGCAVTVRNSTFASINDARALVIEGGTFQLSSSRISNGGMAITGSDFAITNSLVTTVGISITNSHGTASFNTIAETTLPSGAARAVECAGSAPPIPALTDNVIWSPTGAATEMVIGCSMERNLVGPAGTPIGTNFSMDPGFVNAGAENYHLTSVSPAVDRASAGPPDDIDGESRPQGVGWDLGFDEVVP